MAILVDSSVWIDASRANGITTSRLSGLIRGNAAICYTNPIQTEVCQGTRSRLEFERVWNAFLGFQLVTVQENHWEESAWNYFSCRKKGLTVSTMDCLIATIARSYRVPLWTLDQVFPLIQPIIGFDLFA